jgi:hypothetical protein
MVRCIPSAPFQDSPSKPAPNRDGASTQTNAQRGQLVSNVAVSQDTARAEDQRTNGKGGRPAGKAKQRPIAKQGVEANQKPASGGAAVYLKPEGRSHAV